MEAWLSDKAGDWIELKLAVQNVLGLDRDATHVFASVILLIILALALRRPIWDWLVWSGVLLVQLMNEAVSGYADWVLEEWEVQGSIGDVLLVMAMPTLLLIVCRVKPGLVAPTSNGSRPLQSDPRLPVRTSSTEEIIDAEYEELGPRR